MSSLFYKCIGGAVIPLAMFATTSIAAQKVVVDATGTNDEMVLQAALDAHPDGATFLLVGDFDLAGPVYIENSDTKIIGAYRDVNGKVKKNASGTYTSIGGDYLSEAFVLGGKGDVRLSERLTNITIKSLYIRKIVGITEHQHVINDDADACELELYSEGVKDLLIENNHLDGGGSEGTINIFGGSKRININNNLFTASNDPIAEDGFHAINLEGRSLILASNGDVESVRISTIRDVSLRDNTMQDGWDMRLDNVKDFKVSDNVFTGTYRGLALTPTGRINLSGVEDGKVSENSIQGTSSGLGYGMLVIPSNFSLLPGSIETNNVDIKGNTISDVPVGIETRGGLKNMTVKSNMISNGNIGLVALGGWEESSVKGNDFSTLLGQGIVWTDLSLQTDTNIPSCSTDISRNHFANIQAWGILLNGGTTGLSLIKNTFDNVGQENPFDLPNAEIFLSFQDMVYAAVGVSIYLPPAFGNTIKTSDPLERVFDGNDPTFAGGLFYVGGEANIIN